MQGLEALYVVEFGDVAGPDLRNGGVAVLETNRVFGGDSGYFYLGRFTVNGNTFKATAKIEKHNPTWGDAFGDRAQSFTVEISGTIGDGVMNGQIERTDRPGMKLPMRLTRKANLP